MKITLCRDDMLQAASQVKQIKRINSLKFNDKTVTCRVTLNKEAIGIFGVPENWIIKLTFAHVGGAVTATLAIASDAELKLGGTVNNIAQTLLNSITGLAGLEKRLISAIKLPAEFSSSSGKSVTIDLNALLKNKLNCNVKVNAIDCDTDSITLDVSFEF